MSPVVVCVVCESPEAAARAVKQLEECSAVHLDSPGLATLAQASNIVESERSCPMAAFQLPLEELQRHSTLAAEANAQAAREASAAGSVGACIQSPQIGLEHLGEKYKALYKYAKRIEDELLTVLHDWLPSNVALFEVRSERRAGLRLGGVARRKVI